jgi:hypothetical protein
VAAESLARYYLLQLCRKYNMHLGKFGHLSKISEKRVESTASLVMLLVKQKRDRSGRRMLPKRVCVCWGLNAGPLYAKHLLFY